MTKHYDIIIVGAGSAGCALAHRLALNSDLSILLLEAGSTARNPMLHIPLGFAFLMKDHKNNWSYKTRPEPSLGDREVDLPRGKVLGGTSAINGMVYVRGQAEDFDHWAELGNTGWSYQDLLPLFKRSEHNENGGDQYRGGDGPLWVSNVRNEFPLCDAFVDAAQQSGHPRNDDINGEQQAGVGFFPNTIKQGRRHSSASAFLTAAKQRKNLTVLTDAHVERVVIENRKAVAVHCLIDGKYRQLHARREIVLCGGAINSPQLLELSGIGRADILKRQGIPVIKELPGVGENLHDHWNSYLIRSMDRGKSYFSESKPIAILKNIFRYLIFRESFLSNPAALVAVFFRAQRDDKSVQAAAAIDKRPDSQIHFAAAASTINDKGNMEPIDGITTSACALRPTSRGSTHIQSADSHKKPAIQVNYLQTEQDQQLAIDNFRTMREIFSQSALQSFGGEELRPGAAVTSDHDILAYIRETGEPVHHLAGSCKMGDDALAVVDAQLRVHDIQGLRVADASIMPQIVSGNTNAACIMIGEKAADLILGQY